MIARERELAAATSLLDRVVDGCCAVILEGDPGVGKTTIWSAARTAAAARGFRVLTARPAEAEAGFSFAAIGDLLRDTLDEVLGELPAPQRSAIEAALLLRESGEPPSPHSVSVALLACIAALATDDPVVLAIDDEQWLDPPSRTVLSFAARRLNGTRVGFLIARRPNGVAAELSAAFTPGRVERVALGPLSAGAIGRLIHNRLGVAFPRPTLVRLHEQAAGNPLYALELARALGSEPVRASEPLPVPTTLRELVRDRLERLSPPTRRELLFAAASARPRVSFLSPTAVAEALEADVIERGGDRIRFAHPLIASVLYADSSSADRRAAHAGLAGIVDDDEEAARHLALATDAPDDEVAARLELAATTARSRGAPGAAAELLERASAFSGDPGSRDRRLVEAANDHWAGGTDERMTELLDEVMPRLEGIERARALCLLAYERRVTGDHEAAIALLEEALEHAQGDETWMALVHTHLSNAYYGAERMSEAHREALAAATLAEKDAAPLVRAEALAGLAHLELVLAHGLQEEALERATAFERSAGQPGQIIARHTYGLDLLASGRLDEARALFEEAYEEARLAGHVWQAGSLHLLGYTACRSGNLEVAFANAETELAFRRQETPATERIARFDRALAAAHRGDVELARADADEAIRLCTVHRDACMLIESQWVRGYVELALGDAAGAYGFFEPAVAQVLAAGFHEPCAYLSMFQDTIDALSDLGRPDEGEALLAWLDRMPENRWAQTAATYARGTMAAARGDVELALTELDEAAQGFERMGIPVDEGRALLAIGSAQRRSKQLRAARGTLERALAIFERTGARLWAERARQELARIGGRRPAGDELTASERCVAELAAGGRSTKEIAAELVVSPKTVEGHLSSAYAKLGVRSRVELARRLGERVPTEA